MNRVASEGPPGFASRSLATKKVHYEDGPVVAVVAEDRYVAKGALELMDVDHEMLPAVADVEEATNPKSTLLLEEKQTNVMNHHIYSFSNV